MSRKLRYKEAAELLGVAIGSLYSWVSTEKIPHMRYGRRLVVFDEDALKAWMAAREVPIKSANAPKARGA